MDSPGSFIFGALNRNRTDDLFLTKEALYRLSYKSMNGADDGNRTRVVSLGSWNSAIELHPQKKTGWFPLARIII